MNVAGLGPMEVLILFGLVVVAIAVLAVLLSRR